MTRTDVLIVGAGPTGLTLACELAARGVAFRIVDRAARFFGGSRADGIQPRTMEVLADLGVIDEIVASGGLDLAIRAYRGDEVVWEGQMTEPVEPTPSVPYPNTWFVPQFRTEEILRERLAALGGRVETATELTGFTQDADGVTAVLTSGTVRARYLVGADGGRSTVRKRLGIAFPGETDESTTMLFADARVDGVDRSHGRIWQTGDDGVMLTPLAGSDLFVVTARPPEDASEPVHEYLRRKVREVSGQPGIVVREVTWHTTWRANSRLAERFSDGRVFLAGDAGHVHPPTGGQGMNTGIQDGYNLGWKLAAVLSGASPSLLDSYAPERMAAARAALELSTRLLDKHRRGDDDAHVRGPEVHQLALNYRGGPLSRDERAVPGPVTAGDRAPDAPAATSDGPVRLFDLLHGPHWTLLAFGAAHAPEVAAMNAAYGPALRACTVTRPGEPAEGDAVCDTDGHLRTGYGDDAWILIRPDGYIGLITESAERVSAYWTALHGPATTAGTGRIALV